MLSVNYSLLSLVEDFGTTDDGTSQRANPQQGVDPDFDDSTSEHFTPNTRDVTLRRLYTLILNQRSTLYNITSRGDTYLRGFAYGKSYYEKT